MNGSAAAEALEYHRQMFVRRPRARPPPAPDYRMLKVPSEGRLRDAKWKARERQSNSIEIAWNSSIRGATVRID